MNNTVFSPLLDGFKDSGDYDLPIVLTSIYLVGVSLSMYPPAIFHLGETQIMRLDWLFSIPLVLYALIHWNRSLSRPVFAALLFVGALVVSLVANPVYSYFNFATYIFQIIYNICVLAAIISFQFDSRRLISLYRIWVGILLVMSVYAIYQSFALNYGLPLSNVYLGSAPPNFPAVVHDYSRPTSFFREPRWFSVYLVTGIAILLGSIGTRSWFIFEDERREYVSLAIFTVALILLGSFGGYLSFGTLLVLGTLLPTTRWLSIRVGAAVAGFFVFIVPVTAQFGWSFSEMILARVTNNFIPLITYVTAPIGDLINIGGGSASGGSAGGTDGASTATPTADPSGGGSASDGSAGGTDGASTAMPTVDPSAGKEFEQQQSSMKARFTAILGGLFAWKSNLLFGVGPGQFAAWSAAIDLSSRIPLQAESVDALHSYWVEILASSGLVGFACILGLWGSVLDGIRDVWEQATARDSALLVAGVLIFGVQAVDALWDVGIAMPIRWIFLALIFSHVRSIQMEDETHDINA